MTKYRIDHFNKTFSCLHGNDTILIGAGDLNMLTDSEVIEHISNSLMHEHIHMELYKLFNDIVSKLFDGIEHLFGNVKLSEKVIPSNRESYQTYIKRAGFKRFLEYYNLNKYDVVDANKLCNFRRKNDKVPK